MHIVVLAHRVPYPPNKGEKLRTYHQLEYLLNQGHSITLLSPAFSQQDSLNAQQLANTLNIEVVTSKPTHKILRMMRALIFNTSFSEAEFFIKDLSQQFALAAQKAEAILLTASSLTPYLSKVNAAPNCIKLIDFMDVDSDKWSQYARFARWPMSMIYKREHKEILKLEKQSIEMFDAAFVISENEQAMFNEKVLNTSKLHVLGNGIKHEVFAPSSEKSAQTINLLFTGVMDYKPNIDAVHWFVNNCWEQIKADIPNVTFTVAGMSPVKSITELSEDKQIEITGFVEDIMPFYNKAHIFVAPFTIARGVQNKVLQAMSCAIPVVTTSLGAEGIKCTNDKDILIANTRDEFVKHCIALSNEPEYRQSIAEAARNTILQHYAWHSVLLPLSTALTHSQNIRA